MGALLAFSLSAGDVLASPANDAVTASLFGTYECNLGWAAGITPTRPAKVDEYTSSNPFLRVTISSASKADLLWWDKSKQTWNEDIAAADLKIKQIEVKESYWAVTFEGTFGDRLPAAVFGFLSSFSSDHLSKKPTLVLTQVSPLFAGASALSCDKL